MLKYMVKTENTTSILSISSPKMDCSKVIELLKQDGFDHLKDAIGTE